MMQANIYTRVVGFLRVLYSGGAAGGRLFRNKEFVCVCLCLCAVCECVSHNFKWLKAMGLNCEAC